MIFQRLGSNLIRKTYLNSILIQIGPRGVTVFAGTASFGLGTEAVGFKWMWTHEIIQYRFDK
jgi:hypothetical protein